MRNCQYCGKEFNKKQVCRNKKYCSRQCFADSHFGEKVEWNGVRMRPGKMLETLKLCCAGMTPKQACQRTGAERNNTIRWLQKIPEAAELLSKHVCPTCSKDMLPPLNRMYCSKNCKERAKYARDAAAKGIKQRSVNYEGQRKALELYQGGYDSNSIAQLVNVTQRMVRYWLYHFEAAKNFPPLRRQLKNAKTADEWVEMLRNSASTTETSDIVILVCARLYGSGAAGRYIGIASEQFWREDFYDGVCVAFCNILENAVTTIEWRVDNFHLTRTFKTTGTFVWPDEKLGRSIEVTRAEFECLLSLKKSLKSRKKTQNNAGNTCVF